MTGLEKIEGFDWDNGNKGKNYLKHGITDKEAEEVFKNSPLIAEGVFCGDEKRYQLFGVLNEDSITVIFTVRNNKIRVISARKMSKKERSFYNERTKEKGKTIT